MYDTIKNAFIGELDNLVWGGEGGGGGGGGVRTLYHFEGTGFFLGCENGDD